MITRLLTEYQQHQASLAGLAERLERDLNAMLAEGHVTVHFVSRRLKAPESLKRKLARPEKTYKRLWDVTDLVGLRVATYFEDTIDDVARLIERRWPVDFARSSDKLRFTDHGTFGYRSLHYVCAPAEGAPDPAFRFEVQVRTALQHAWAEVEHDLGYKADAVPEQIRRRFSRIASLLEIADQEFVSIRRDLSEYQRQVAEALATPSRALPVDVLSLEELARRPDVAALDEAVAKALGRPRAGELYFPGYLVKLLHLAGLGTTDALQAALERHGAQVPAAVKPYFEFARRAWQLEPGSLEAVHSGYSLFFLAHVAILKGPELGLSKVARLTRLYQELDEPGDERSAHEIASGLVAAFSGE